VIATQLITVAATLTGVLLTLVVNAYLERRRAQDTRDVETLRLASEQAKWLRDERVTTYATFSLAGEQVLQFIRSEFPSLMATSDDRQRMATEEHWRDLRTELRKAYNRVLLLGTDEARDAGRQVWSTAWHSGNDLLRDLGAEITDATAQRDLTDRINAATSQLGTVGDRFLDACSKDLQH
jgi:hypothetical protein